MLLLAIDTATPAVSVALLGDGEVLAQSTQVDARRHGELLAPSIEAVLAQAGMRPGSLGGVAVGVGPGPFTGLRVGIVTATTMADALGILVHGVCSLDALAFESPVPGPFAVVTDARRREVYWRRYDDRVTAAGEPAVGRPDEVGAAVSGLTVLGEGPHLYPTAFPAGAQPQFCSAAALGRLALDRLAAGQPLLPPRPLYLRRPDAVEPSGRKPVLR